MEDRPDISVLIATHNRAELLRQTLDDMGRLEFGRLAVQIVVIDNNSTDATRTVVKEYSDRLPVLYLFEERAGKNCALNRALSEVELGWIVAFCDDDICPEASWLSEMQRACEDWPDVQVFGGKIEPIWPTADIPSWADDPAIRGLAFGLQDLGDSEVLYDESGAYPFGGNMWVRREVFEGGRRFDESVGPRPKGRKMGSETSLLVGLRQQGMKMAYVPSAVVGHRIQSFMLDVGNLRRRALRHGRGQAHYRGIHRPQLLARSRWRWFAMRWLSLARLSAQYAISRMLPRSRNRILRQVALCQSIGWTLSSISIAREQGSQAE